MINFHVVTIFPDSFSSYINESILKRAQKKKLLKINFYNPRDFAKDKHRTTDDKPYGGGPGMVMLAKPILAAAESAKKKIKGGKAKMIILSPRGKQFTNSYAARLAKNYKHVVLVSGHYEGIDARVKKILKAEEISVGPYTLTGGEIPAMVVIDATVRNIKNVLGKDESLEEKRVASGEIYTRPGVLEHKKKKYKVPKILLSGHHKKITEWRKHK